MTYVTMFMMHQVGCIHMSYSYLFKTLICLVGILWFVVMFRREGLLYFDEGIVVVNQSLLAET